VPHRFRCTRGPGHLLFLFTPGGFERFLRETAEPASDFSLPPEGSGMPDPERLGPALERAQAELLA
jgi:hypothetical protein